MSEHEAAEVCVTTKVPGSARLPSIITVEVTGNFIDSRATGIFLASLIPRKEISQDRTSASVEFPRRASPTIANQVDKAFYKACQQYQDSLDQRP